ncbi:site-specific integrase [Sutterella sp.]|uniref:tyrosine-type recombinase/integrase n=1 Tax=Sutterella sp. TaxID=1981025 RepID=UPI0026E0E40D|nr:site-specific integrase [Sutterella sp.]MDO5532560.1 site-specific integrase [Sutterella sp.]
MQIDFEAVSDRADGVALTETDRKTSPISLASPVDEGVNAALAYLAELSTDVSRSVVRSRLNVAARWLGFPDAASCPWGQLRFVHVVGFLHELSDKRGLSANSVNAYLSAVKGVAETAWRLRQMDHLSFAEIKAVKSLRVYREPAGRALTSDESRKLIEAAESESGSKSVRDQAVLALLLGCGLRRAEVTRLRFENLSLADGTLRVIGKGNKERKVFLSGVIAEKVRAWVELRGDTPGWLFGRITKGGRVLLNSPLDPSSVGRIVGRAQDDSGIAPITTHDLRRTFATRLLAKNVDIVAVKNLMGHSNVATTAKYDRRSEEALQRAAELAEL